MEMISTREVPAGLSEEIISDHMSSFLGDQYQTPPMFSAKKVDGVPLQNGTKSGKTVEREPRFIRINQLKLTNWSSPRGSFYMECSKGTYVRTVLHDLGQKLEMWGSSNCP